MLGTQLQFLSHIQHGPSRCEILVSHIGTSEQLDLVGCDPLLVGLWFLMFRSTVFPQPPRVHQSS
jgi:hypothetical protein